MLRISLEVFNDEAFKIFEKTKTRRFNTKVFTDAIKFNPMDNPRKAILNFNTPAIRHTIINCFNSDFKILDKETWYERSSIVFDLPEETRFLQIMTFFKDIKALEFNEKFEEFKKRNEDYSGDECKVERRRYVVKKKTKPYVRKERKRKRESDDDEVPELKKSKLD
ncbi:hypothetical protein [Carp edema virus]|nr:hypothetical protein [Carp edema virus]